VRNATQVETEMVTTSINQSSWWLSVLQKAGVKVRRWFCERCDAISCKQHTKYNRFIETKVGRARRSITSQTQCWEVRI